MAESFAELLKTLVAPIAILITWWLTKRTQDQQKHRETIAAWHQLLIEIMQCQERMRGIAISEVKAPLYRLPTDAYKLQFPTLMIVSNMDPEKIDTFQRYYQFVDQLNQGLDLAAAAAQTHDDNALKKHFDRNRTKAKQLVDEEGTQGSLYDRARAAVFAQLERLGDKRYVEWIKKKQRVGEKIEEPDEGATKRQPTS
jgi:hypothetical protein